MTDLRVGEQFYFDGELYTVAEPPQCLWGLVELWVEELDVAFEGSETSTVYRPGTPAAPRSSWAGKAL